MRALICIVAAVALSACATSEPPTGPPSLVVAAGTPAPPQARLYVDCVTQAAGANTYDREANTLRFQCTGEVAQRFFDGLGAWSAQVRSEYTEGGRTWRFSTPLRENPSGVDFCRRDAERYECTVVLNVGEFLSYEPAR